MTGFIWGELMNGKVICQILAMVTGFMVIVGMLIIADITDSATINNMPYRPTPHTTAVATQIWGNFLTSQTNDTSLNTQLNAVSTVAVACASRTPVYTATPIPTPSAAPTSTPIPTSTPVSIDPLSVTSLVVNDVSGNNNTRIETNTLEYGLFVDGTNNRIMFGVATPPANYYTGIGFTGYRDLGSVASTIAYSLGSDTTMNGTAGAEFQCCLAVKALGDCADGKSGADIGISGEAFASVAATPTASPPQKIGLSGVTAPLAGWVGYGVVGLPLLQNTSGTVSKTYGVCGKAPYRDGGAGSMTVTTHYSVYGEDPNKNSCAGGYSGYFEKDVYIGGNVDQSGAANGSYYRMPYGGTPTPVASAGQMQFNTDWKCMSFHDGTRWRPMGFDSMQCYNAGSSADEAAFVFESSDTLAGIADLDKTIIIFGIHASSSAAVGSGDTMDVEVRVAATPSALNARLAGDTQTGASDYVDAGVTVAAGSSFTVNCNTVGGTPETGLTIVAVLDYITLW